jgi:hypothetical protein
VWRALTLLVLVRSVLELDRRRLEIRLHGTPHRGRGGADVGALDRRDIRRLRLLLLFLLFLLLLFLLRVVRNVATGRRGAGVWRFGNYVWESLGRNVVVLVVCG